MQEEIMLQFQNVTDKKRAPHLKNINFYLKEGYLMGLVGKNGAGKTTLLSHLLNNEIAYSGDILFQGNSIKKNKIMLKQNMAYISEEYTFMYDITAMEHALLFGHFYKNWDSLCFMEMLSAFQVPELQKVQTFSRGENMKFQLAFAMAHHPNLYIIDEATAGMDVVFKKEFYKTLRLITQQHASILMTTHSESEVRQYMDYIVTLKDSTIASIVENVQ